MKNRKASGLKRRALRLHRRVERKEWSEYLSFSWHEVDFMNYVLKESTFYQDSSRRVQRLLDNTNQSQRFWLVRPNHEELSALLSIDILTLIAQGLTEFMHLEPQCDGECIVYDMLDLLLPLHNKLFYATKNTPQLFYLVASCSSVVSKNISRTSPGEKEESF